MPKLNIPQEIIEEINQLIPDPIGDVIVKVWRFEDYELRWNSGTLQYRKVSDEFFSVPELAIDFLEMCTLE
jgi:hypothetical protein